MGRIKLLALGAGAVATLAALPVVAQKPDQPGSSFALVGQPAPGGEQVAKSGGTLLELKARPVSAVRLATAIAPETAALFGAKADAPFDTGRTLYGWPERPGLYCDLLRTRGLGLSTACLYDTDGDGRFDEGRRFDFNSGFGDLLGVTPSGKIIGVRTNAKKPGRVPLPQPIAYTNADVPAETTGRLALKWRRVKAGDGHAAQLWITTPDNYTGTEGISEQVAQFPLSRVPIDGELYGVKLRVLGFDEKGAMRYQVIEVRDGAAVPLRFRGYTFRIMMI
jgi:hypothetical protein